MTVPPPQDRPEQWSQNHPPQQGPSGTPWGAGTPQGFQAPHGDQAPQGHQAGRSVQAPPPAGPTRSSRGRNTLIGAIAGLLVAALVVGGLTLAGVVHFGSDSSVADTRAVDLPETLGDLTDLTTASIARGAPRGDALGERNQRTYARTAELYRTAFDGAGVGVRTYTNADLEFFLTVIAVRADSPGLVQGGPQADPADLGLVASPSLYDLVVDGDVQCLQSVTQQVREGEQVEDEDLRASVCRTTADGLTVYVFTGGGTEGTEGRQQLVDLARAARDGIAGS